MQTITYEIEKLLGGNKLPRLESAPLRLDKFVCYSSPDEKGQEIRSIVKMISENQRVELSPRLREYPGAITTIQKLQSRLIINQAGGVIENAGMCLHRHLGFPYLPGSTVKGCARHFAWQQWKWMTSEAEGTQEEQGIRLALTFGYPTGDPDLDKFLQRNRPELFGESGALEIFAGTVIFLPAYPTRNVLMGTDIVNCHHPNYYAGRKDKPTATDDEDPIPNFFPVVESGASFSFTLAPISQRISRALAVSGMKGFNPLQFAMDCLQKALQMNGIGAKTAAGYGWFREDSEARSQIEQELKKKEEEENRRKEEERRKAEFEAKTPEERQIDLLSALDREAFILRIKTLEAAPEFEQRCVLQTLKGKYLSLWNDDKKEKKPGKKGFERAEIVRRVAAKLGVQMP